MTGVDYGLFYRTSYADSTKLAEAPGWDTFISAYNPSQRVGDVFASVRAGRKQWLGHAEYCFAPEDVPPGTITPANAAEEDECIANFFAESGINPTSGSLCVDVTGFMRPHLMFLLRYLLHRGVVAFDALYSEPIRYSQRHRTPFTDGGFMDVRQVKGFEGINIAGPTADDVLLLGVGYEHHLIGHVINNKELARQIPIFAFPPLQADFYQESLLRTGEVIPSLADRTRHFAPAYDPFGAAHALQQIVRREEQRKPLQNLYMSPLSTRAQALGFALYYLYEREGTATSIIYPRMARYRQGTSEGIGRIWSYHIELSTAA